MSSHPFRFLLSVALLVAVLAGARASAAEPVRVVSQAVGTDELLLALADPSQIACLSHLAREPAYSAVAREAAAYPALERGDAETILRHRPTLLLAADYSRVELVEQVRRTGVKVVLITRYHTLEDAFANLRLVAAELGGEAPARAEAIIADGERRVAVLRERLRGVTPVRVIAPSTYGLIAGAGTTFSDLCAHAGAINLAETLGGLRGHQPPPVEKMLTWPIDKVVVEGVDDETAIAPFLKHPPYQFMAAVRERRLARIERHMLSSVSHHRIAAYEMLARALHPEAFR